MTTKRTVRRRRRRPTETLVTMLLDTATDGELAVDERHPLLTGGDVDADWQRAEACGDEAVGGSTATPDQDVVDEIGRALGVEAPDGEELRMSDDILRNRDRFRWHLERDAEDEAQGRTHRRRGTF